MKIIIIGATGFIGSALYRYLENEKYSLVATTRDKVKAKSRFGSCNWVAWDGVNANALAEIITGTDVLINLAGENVGGKWTNEVKTKILDSRVKSAQAIVDAVAKSKQAPPIVIQASAIGFYGSSGDIICNEESRAGKGFLAEVVAKTESTILKLDTTNTRLIIARLGIVLGNDGGVLPRMMQMFHRGFGGHLGDGKSWFSWIHLHDVLKAFLFMIQNKQLSGVFNLTSPNPTQSKHFAATIAQAMGKKSWLHVPEIMLRLMFGEQVDEIFLTSQRITPQRLLDNGFTFEFTDVESALSNLIRNKV